MSLPETPRPIPIAVVTEPAAAMALPLPRPLGTAPQPGPVRDARQRPLRDLRISVTDRCNFRCGYCMPRSAFGKDHAFLPHRDLLSFEEITRVARVMATLGVRKLRLTGGEPLLRKGLEDLIAQLAELRTPDGAPLELALTTNGTLLARKAAALKAAGLHRVTVSLDALDADLFARMSDADVNVADVLAGIDAAQAVGLGPVKVNMVVQSGVNDQQILPMARHFRGRGVVLRFIEFMDVGQTNRWQMDQVMPSAEVLARLRTEFSLTALSATHVGETAERWAHADGQGELGFISSVTQAFCGDCNRLRLSTDGRLYTCLFASQGHDLRAALRAESPWDDSELADSLRQLWQRRQDRYSELRQAEAPQPHAPQAEGTAAMRSPRIEMSYIGG